MRIRRLADIVLYFGPKRPPKRPPRKDGEPEGEPVEPPRPRPLAGGAAAELEFDD
jgi:hypothetical protein